MRRSHRLPPFVRAAALLFAAALIAVCDNAGGQVADPDAVRLPATGRDVPGLESYDRIIREIMARHGVPGGAIAVAKDGRLVLARGYGWSDVENEIAVEPDALFRIASISKPITAVAIMTLVENGRLSVADHPFEILADIAGPPGTSPDPRLADITIEQLLRHSGGWDRERSFDPMFRPGTAAASVGEPAPASAETVIRYMLGQPLDFDPGSRVAYSNFGYDVLGRVIERVTGRSYGSFVRDDILAPAGVTRMRLGRTRLAERADGEVLYYVPGQSFGRPEVTSVFPGEGPVPAVYGGFYIEAMDAHGGWISSAIDLVRFALATDGRPSRPDILQPATLDAMTAPSAPWAGSSYHIGYAWFVRPAGSDANWWHGGSLPGTSTILVRANTDVVWAAVFNARTDDGVFASEIDSGMWLALREVTEWPAHDLFREYE